jgi:Protein phosphatase 2C
MHPSFNEDIEKIAHNEWDHLSFAACALVGPSHLSANKPCEDSFGTLQMDDLFIAVVSDGAGSARHGKEAAEIISHALPPAIIKALKNSNGLECLEFDALKAAIIEAISEVRNLCEKAGETSGASLPDYSATLLGIVISKNRSVIFHIGDGAIGCFKKQETLGLSSWVTTAFSEPMNGQFINETFFFNAPDWQSAFRIQAMSDDFHAVLMMTDGVTPFALSRAEQTFDRSFTSGLLNFLQSYPPEISVQSMRNLLSRKESLAASDDDKTLLWIGIKDRKESPQERGCSPFESQGMTNSLCSDS